MKGQAMRLQSGDTLRALIRQRGLNQSRLAAAAGCSASFINGLCAETKLSCSDGLAARIADALEVPTGVLFMPTQSRDTVHNPLVHGTAVVA
jgi:transcriptional regulator with XRE-family HTH domain